jgi:UDP-N-acetylglucosamine--N-acetylmuramyl-(pentapeptide) pyrophosphoryl-undecaprenol N-acetylglucosamine transferase
VRVIFSGGGTGGHLYPALAIARALVRLAPEVSPFFVGAERGIEREVLPATEFAHRLLPLHPIYRSQPWLIGRTAAGLVRSWRLLAEEARRTPPHMVVGTGGYASAAALAHARAHRIPYLLQEQNGHPGMVTRMFAGGAREICLGYRQAEQLLRPGRRTVISATGNPIDPPPEPRPSRATARQRWGFPAEGGVVLLISGGSQGALPLNEAVAAWVRGGIPEGLFLIWGTGRGMHERYASLGSDRVRVEPYLSPIAEAYAASELAISRAGALTLAELSAWGIPSVMVPLPSAAADHQTANAREIADEGAGVLLPQRELTAARLAETISELLSDSSRLAALARAAELRARPRAAEDIARRILTHLDLKQHQT